MFDDYRNGQPVIYNFFSNIVKGNKINHAYLFDTKNLIKKMNFINALTKMLVCEYNYANNKNCGTCNICERIDKNNFAEVKIIEPDGFWIKKEQIIELQKRFSTKSVESKYKIYIIKNCELLNKHAANSLLKFLEEPEEGIIAILITDNIHKVLNTILSRCQVFSFKKEAQIIVESNLNSSIISKVMEYKNDIDKEICIKIINSIVDFVFNLEVEKEKSMLFINSIFDSGNKIDMFFVFDIMILFYKDVLNFICGRNIEFFDGYVEKIEKISKLNDIMRLGKKIKIVIELQSKVNYNANVSLLFDKLIINITEV